MRKVGWVLLGLTIAGCAGKPSDPASRPAVQRSADDPAWLTLDQIQPTPTMPAPAPTPDTRPAVAPIEAVHLYARAVGAQLSGQRAIEIDLLRKALELDPRSYALHFALGEALVATGQPGVEAALEQFQLAAGIEPDRIEVQFELGRLHLARGDAARAIEHLRLALDASDAAQFPVEVTKAHLYLARALQQQGHYLAAIDQYEKLLYRLDRRVHPRTSAELWHYHNRRDLVHIQLADLNEKLGRYAEALGQMEKVIERQPGAFPYNAKLVRLLLKMGQREQARDLAAELVSENRASTESLSLLREVFREMGREDAAADELRKIIARRPGDRAMVYALVDALAASGRDAEARRLLVDALRESNHESSVVFRLFEFQITRGEVTAAAKLLIDALAARPENVDDFDSLWIRLVKGTMSQRLRLEALEAIEVDEKALPSKLYWQSRLAGAGGKSAAALAALEKAVGHNPPFTPAYRQLFIISLTRRDWPEPARIAAAERLIDRAKDQDQLPLATELIGRLLLAQQKPDEAAGVLAKAMELGQTSPIVAHARAVALRAAKKDAEAEELLWRITHDHSTFEPAYVMLFGMNNQQNDAREAIKVLQAWMSATPFSVNANLINARILLDQGRRGDAEAVLARIFREEPDNPTVIQALTQFYSGRDAELLAKLEEEHRRNPANRAVAGLLAMRYHQARRASEALRILDDLRQAAASDPDELLHVATLYTELEHPELAERALLDALKIDPRHAQVSNHLGYTWADEGKNLEEAERLIRQALSAEPGNAAYLDSLGWVLYKRGQFEEARQRLQAAIDAMERPDPVVLDHLGDALYRLGRRDEAAKAWQQALDRLGDEPAGRQERVRLGLVLRKKLDQHKEDRPVDVAPLGTAGN